MNTNEIYQMVTDTITELLDDHLETWNKPWISFGQDNDYARNPSTARYYNGINQFLLSYVLMKKGYLKNVWMTFNQIKQEGGAVNKGEKSYPVIFYKTAYIDKNKKYYAPDTVKTFTSDKISALCIESIPVLKLYRVFNVAQTQGLAQEHYDVQPQGELLEFEKDEAAENLIRATGAHIEFRQSNRAYYDRSADKIVLPLREQFKGMSEPYYATSLHELGHWTGHETRLNRKNGASFGDLDYAKEELVAELTSAFCCAQLRFTKNITQNAAYIKSWLVMMKQDNRAVIKAASDAQKAADYILACSRN